MMEKLARFTDAEFEVELDQRGELNQNHIEEQNAVDEGGTDAEETKEEEDVGQHLASELLGDEEYEEDIDEKEPGSARSAAIGRDRGVKVPSVYLDNSGNHAENPEEARTVDVSEEIKSEATAEDSGSVTNNFATGRESAREFSKWDDYREPASRIVQSAPRDGFADSHRSDFVPDRQWRRDADHHKGFEGPPRREDISEFNRRTEGVDQPRRIENFDFGRRTMGDGYSDQGRRADGFDSRRSDGFNSRRVDNFEPRRVDLLEPPRRNDGFDGSKRADVHEPIRRVEGFDQHKRIDQGRHSELAPNARWNLDQKVNDSRIIGDRALPPDASRFPPKVEMRHEIPRAGMHQEGMRGPPMLDSNPSSSWNKNGPERYPGQKEWVEDRELSTGGVGPRYPPTRAGADSMRGGSSGLRNVGAAATEVRWNHDTANPDGRIGYGQGRSQNPQSQGGNEGPILRDNLAVRSRIDTAGPNLQGNSVRGREIEIPWNGQPGRTGGRGFSDNNEIDRGRDRIHAGNAHDQLTGFAGSNSASNLKNGAFPIVKPKSPPRQAVGSTLEDRRLIDNRRTIDTRLKDPRDATAPNNFSGPVSPRTPTATFNGKPVPSQLQLNAGQTESSAEKGRIESKSRWGRIPLADGAVSQSPHLQEPPVQSPRLQQPYRNQQLQPQYQQQTQMQQLQGQSQAQVQVSQPQSLAGLKDSARPEIGGGNHQHGGIERTDLRGNIAMKKRKLDEEQSNPASDPSTAGPQNFDAQPVPNPERQRNVISLKGINTQSVRPNEPKVQQEPGFGNMQKRVRTVRSEDAMSTHTTTVTITGINVEDHRGPWGPGNKGRGGFHGGGRGRGRG